MAHEGDTAAGSGRGGERRLALVVSSSIFDQEPTLPALPGVQHDADAFARILGDPQVGAFDVETVVDRPSHEVALEIQKFVDGAHKTDTVLLYLTGHGVQDRRARLYFATVNTVSKFLESTALDARWLLGLLENCKARRQIVILDCCFSGAAGGVGMGGEVDLRAQLVGQGRGRVLLTSSRGDQQSFQVETLGKKGLRQMSVFTAGLVDGLRTGEADRDRDGLISVEDAFDHAVEFVHEHGALQNPQRWLHDAEGRIILAFSPYRDRRKPKPRPKPRPRFALSPLAQFKPELSLVHTLSGDEGWIHDVAFTSDGTLLVAVTSRGRVLGWDPVTGKVLFSMAAGSEAAGLWHIAVSADGELVAAGGGDGTVSVFDLRTRRLIRSFDTASMSVHALAFSPVTPLLAVALSDAVSLRIPRNGLQVHRRSHKDAHAISLAYSVDGAALAIGADDGTIQIVDQQFKRRLHFWPAGHREPVLALAYLMDRRMIAHAHGSSVEIWLPEKGITLGVLPRSPNATCAAMAVSPRSGLLATATDDGAVHLWNPGASNRLTQVDAHVGGASTVAFHPRHDLLATGGADQAVRLWQLPAL